MKMYNKPSGYSPKEVIELFRIAEVAEWWSLEEVVNANKKHYKKYKQLMEMYALMPLAVCFYKTESQRSKNPTKFKILPGQDPPDLYLMDQSWDGEFAFEVTSIYRHEEETIDFDYAAEARKIRVGKSQKYKENTKICSPFHLIISVRLKMEKFNLTKMKKEIEKYKRYCYSIYISIYESHERKIYCIFPHHNEWNNNGVSFNFDQDQQYIY